MYGENVTFGQASVVCIFSIIIVFFVLVMISYLIDFVAYMINKKKKETTSNKVSSEVVSAVEPTTIKTDNNQNTVAIIAAAIASYLGTGTNNLIVKKITRLSGTDSAWTEMARLDYVSKREPKGF